MNPIQNQKAKPLKFPTYNKKATAKSSWGKQAKTSSAFPTYNKKATAKSSWGKQAKTPSAFQTELHGNAHLSQRDAMQQAMKNEMKGKNPFNYPLK